MRYITIAFQVSGGGSSVGGANPPCSAFSTRGPEIRSTYESMAQDIISQFAIAESNKGSNIAKGSGTLMTGDYYVGHQVTMTAYYPNSQIYPNGHSVTMDLDFPNEFFNKTFKKTITDNTTHKSVTTYWAIQNKEGCPVVEVQSATVKR